MCTSKLNPRNAIALAIMGYLRGYFFLDRVIEVIASSTAANGSVIGFFLGFAALYFFNTVIK